MSTLPIPGVDTVFKTDAAAVVSMDGNPTQSSSPMPRVVSMEQVIKPSMSMEALRAEYKQKFQSFDPTGVLITLMRHRKVQANLHSFKDLQDFFVQPTKRDYETYDFDILKAIRAGDVQNLRKLHSEGRNMTCCNRVKETLLMVAARRGETDVVRFLVCEAKVPVNVCDEYGRTPLHDAFWTAEPNFDLISILIAKSPDLLLVKDLRGHTPLHYAPKQHWKTWVRFLVKNFKSVIPKTLR